jgi:beta-lactamase class A
MKRGTDGGRSAEDAVRVALRGLEDPRGYRVGVRALGLEGPLAGVGFGVGEDEAFPSASLIKVLVLVELLRQADSGRVSLEEGVVIRSEDLVEDSQMLEARGLPARVSFGELAGGMITVSDNAATNWLIRRLGMDRVNALAGELGLRRTSLRREMMDFGARSRGEENTTSASDMVALMRELWAGSTLTRESRDLALGLLLDGRLVSKITFPTPPGARYAHKTGELERVENDAGILLVPGRSFALAVLVEGDVGGAAAPVSGALRAVCGFYAGTGGG